MVHPNPIIHNPIIHYEDQHLIVLSKPAGLLSQSDASGAHSLVDFLREHFGRNYVGLVHRLDRNTSGLMVVAKRSKSADRLSEQLRTGDLVRHYHAVLSGTLETTACWEDWLIKNETNNEVRVGHADALNAKHARLRVEPLLNFNHKSYPLTLARFELETGRSHQIRVQSAHHQFPLVGDSKYAPHNIAKIFSRPALHSSYMSFFHPISHYPMKFYNAMPPDIAEEFSVCVALFDKTE